MAADVEQDIPRLLLELGLLNLRQGSPEDARLMFEATAKLRPDDPTPPLFVGLWHFAGARYADAERQYRQNLKRHPAHELTKAHLGEALIAQKRWNEAEKVLDPVTKQTVDPEAARFAAELLSCLRQGIFQRAV